MDFVNYFDSERPQQVLDEYCSRSKPGADKVNYKKFKSDFNNTLPKIKFKISNKTYKFTRFELALKVKKHYKLPRLIFKASMRDRLVTKLMAQYLEEFYCSSTSSAICQINTRDSVLNKISNSLAQKNVNGEYKYKYFFRIDISSYFDSINRSLLIEQLRQDGLDDNFIHLIKKLFTTMDLSLDIPYGVGIPQGISVSSILAERYLRDFDYKYSSYPYNEQIICIRYVDDMLVLVADDNSLKSIKKSILFDLQSNYGLTINSEKISGGEIDKSAFDFLGTTIDRRNITISVPQIERVEKQLDELFLWYRRISRTTTHPLHKYEDRVLQSLVEKLNLLITGYVYTTREGIQKKYGWILTSLPRQINNVDSLKKLDRHVGALLNAYAPDIDVNNQKKSFYQAYHIAKYTDNKRGYILNRDTIDKNEEEMYRITCNLSLVDVKYGLDYHEYDRDIFEEKVGEPLRGYFYKTLYISNRNLTSDLLYW